MQASGAAGTARRDRLQIQGRRLRLDSPKGLRAQLAVTMGADSGRCHAQCLPAAIAIRPERRVCLASERHPGLRRTASQGTHGSTRSQRVRRPRPPDHAPRVHSARRRHPDRRPRLAHRAARRQLGNPGHDGSAHGRGRHVGPPHPTRRLPYLPDRRRLVGSGTHQPALHHHDAQTGQSAASPVSRRPMSRRKANGPIFTTATASSSTSAPGINATPKSGSASVRATRSHRTARS